MNKGVFQKIIVHPLDVYNYYIDHKDELLNFENNLVTVGDSTVYMTAEPDGTIILNVYIDDTIAEVFEANDEAELLSKYNDALREIGYDPERDYDDFEECDGELPEEGDVEIESDEEYEMYSEMASENEGRFDDICKDVIYEFMGDETGATTKDIEEAAIAIKEIVCSVMHNQFKLPVLRPMILVREDGTRFFTEYPYPKMDETPEEQED